MASRKKHRRRSASQPSDAPAPRRRSRDASRRTGRGGERAASAAEEFPFPESASWSGEYAGPTPSAEVNRATSARGPLSWLGGGGGSALTPESLSTLRRHVINLNQGGFSSGGAFTSTPEDVDAIFREHLPAWTNGRGRQRPLRIVLFAHGGLVSEERGLEIASTQVDWWLRNDVYPLFFVWETGFWETLRQLVGLGERGVAARDIFDHTSDPLFEVAARRLGGPKIWGGMKRSAALAFDRDGGGAWALERLREAVGALGGDRVQLHAIGHSAGSIFHSFLLPTASAMGIPPFRTLQLLAPAISTADFRARLAPLTGRYIERATMFTMKRDIERADSCFAYRKSLLYLIYHALEASPRTEILGLEESLRRDEALSSLFGLGRAGDRHGAGDVVWSTTEASEGIAASRSTTHGDFDNDAPTMNSVLRRVLERPEGEIHAFTSPAAGRSVFAGLDDVAERISEDLERQGYDAESLWSASRGAWWSSASLKEYGPGGPAAPLILPAGGAGGTDESIRGRRCGLCIGIDRYAQSPLDGCVADAKLWNRTLADLGFEMEPLLLDHEATRGAILERMRALVDAARAGDVIVFQYAGHGTRVIDVDGDEADGDTPGFDEAMVPFDYQRGAYVIDDDLAEVFRRAGEGVNITCFFDCCHSGTMNRLWAASIEDHVSPTEQVKARFLPPSAERNEAHKAFREALAEREGERARNGFDGGGRARGVHAAAEVFFSACRSSESALESNGHGHFTIRATGVLRHGIDGLTNEAFHARVLDAFGSARRQTPELHCADDRRGLPLLRALTVDGRGGGGGPDAGAPLRTKAQIAAALEQLARRIR